MAMSCFVRFMAMVAQLQMSMSCVENEAFKGLVFCWFSAIFIILRMELPEFLEMGLLSI